MSPEDASDIPSQKAVNQQDPQTDEDVSPIQTPGARSKSPWKMPRKAWVQVLKRTWVMAGFHNLNLLAAGVAFFTFLSITPLIAATVMIYGLVGNVETVQRQMAGLTDVLPADASTLIEEQLVSVVTTNASVTGFALAVALFFAVYGGMRAANGLVSALNVINEEHETRNIIQVTLRAASLTLAAILIAIVGVSSGSLFAWLQTQSTDLIGPVAQFFVKLLTWVFAILLASTGFATIMRFGPDRATAQWRWLMPGALLATFLFIGISFGFSLYVAYVSDYNATYGSLSAIVVFLMWLFLSAYCILIGALINAEAERQTIQDSTTGPEQPLGERGAVMADTTLIDGHKLSMHQKRLRRKAEKAARKAS